MLIEPPKVLSKLKKAEYEKEVWNVVHDICTKHKVSYSDLRVRALRSPGRRVFPAIQILNPSGEAKAHFAISMEIKAQGWAPGMLFGFSRPGEPHVVMSPMFYPLSPDVEVPSFDVPGDAPLVATKYDTPTVG